MTATDTDPTVALEAAYVEALADETLGAYGRAMQIASDPAIRDHILSVRGDSSAVAHVRVLLRKDGVSLKRLRELRKLRDNSEKALAQTEAPLSEAQNVADTAKRRHEELRAKTSQCELGIESVQYQFRMYRYAGMAVAAEVKAAGIDV